MSVKLAYIGGGSLFVPSIINGIAHVMQASAPFEVELALYDTDCAKAVRMEAYAAVVRDACKVPLRARTCQSRAEALDGADVVLVSVWLAEEHKRLDRVVAGLGFRLPEEGPGAAGWAVACAPWCLEVASDMTRYCPEALFVTVMNPTDVLAGVVGTGGGVRAAGLCVEVDGLRGALAYYLRTPYESIELRHGGVNHDGWVLDFNVDGQDGYALLAARWGEIERDPDFHPGNDGLRPIWQLAGHLKSSGYHNWPLHVERAPEHEARQRAWGQGKRERYLAALGIAIQTREPITDPPAIHPERSRLNYPYTGITVGRLLQSIALEVANVIPLQIPNRGAITNFPDDAIVEVPTRVHGRTLTGTTVGTMPEWLGGYTRLLAVQRRLIVEYVLDRRLATLKQALATLPMFGTVQQLNRYADALHAEFGDNN